MKPNQKWVHRPAWLATLAACALCASASDTAPTTKAGFEKPDWLAELSAGVKEGYDDNILGVSGHGLEPQGSWITTFSPRIGLNFLPLLGHPAALQTLSLTYTPEFNLYHDASAESYDAHRVGTAIQAKTGGFSLSLDNAFLFNDGSSTSPLYALNQLPGAAANQNDKYRNFFAQAATRERRRQIQDRNAIALQYQWDDFFIRPTASLLFYNLQTDWHNSSLAPYKGYQNWPDRYDVNGGIDLGYYLTPKLAATLGYRYGHQYQEQFTAAIDPDNHFSSSDYQRVLLGLEGHPWPWLKLKLAGGPDFRDYNSLAPVNDLHPVKYYGQATITATITPSQSLTFNYKQWQWVSATGKVPYFDSLFALNYHWEITRQLGWDATGTIQEADFTSGNETTGAAASLRDDRQYILSTGVTYTFTRHLSANATYAYYLGQNALASLPASLQPDYRNFTRNLASLGMQYKF